MPRFYVMRRANGELMSEIVNNNQLMPVWPDFLSLEKYKVFNPELSLFLPTQIDERMIASLKALEKQGTKFLLMSSEEHSPNLKDGLPFTVDRLEESIRPAA